MRAVSIPLQLALASLLPDSVEASDSLSMRSHLKYLIASDSELVHTEIVKLINAYNLVRLTAGVPPSDDPSEILFLQRKDALRDGRINEDVIEGLIGAFRQGLLAAEVRTDECYIEAIPLGPGRQLTVMLSTTVQSLSSSLQCFSVGL